MEEATYQLVQDFFRQQYYHQQIMTQPNPANNLKFGSFTDQTTTDKKTLLAILHIQRTNTLKKTHEIMIVYEFEPARIKWNLRKL